jgi:hypothetical protein
VLAIRPPHSGLLWVLALALAGCGGPPAPMAGAPPIQRPAAAVHPVAPVPDAANAPLEAYGLGLGDIGLGNAPPTNSGIGGIGGSSSGLGGIGGIGLGGAGAALPPLPPAAVFKGPTPGERFIPFSSTRVQSSFGGFDVFLFDPATGTVLAIPGLNTAANEIHPRLSLNGRFLVYASNVLGNYRIFKYDLANGTIDALVTLNDPTIDQVSPTIDDSGQQICYLARLGGISQLRLHNLATHVTVVPAPVDRLGPTILTPQISGDGHWVTFSAGTPLGTDIYLYRVGDASVSSPPFVNTLANEIDPVLSDDGTRMLFASDRRGTGFSIYEANLVTGFIDNLALANDLGNNINPRYLDAAGRDIIFESDRTGSSKVYLYRQSAGVVDTLPLMHELGEDDMLGNTPAPADVVIGGSSGLFGSLGGRFRGGFGRRGAF